MASKSESQEHALHDKPTLNSLLPVIPRLAVKWFDLGLTLGAKAFALNIIKTDQKDDCEGCCSKMLQNWLNGKADCGTPDRPVTWETLLCAIQGAVDFETSEYIRREVLKMEDRNGTLERDNIATSSSNASVGAQKVEVTKGEFEILHTLAETFVTTIGLIVSSLVTAETAEKILEALKAAALCKMSLGGVPNPPSEADVNNAPNVRHLFYLVHIFRNWVDISLLEQMVTVSNHETAAAILKDYKESHESFISKAVARLVDPSTDGTCPHPDANSCILQLVFSDKRECMRVREVLDCKTFLYDRFGVQPESIEYISAVIGNSLVVSWLVLRHIGLRAMNQCRSTPVLAALRKIQVLAVRLRYPGQLIAVETNVTNMPTRKPSDWKRQVAVVAKKSVCDAYTQTEGSHHCALQLNELLCHNRELENEVKRLKEQVTRASNERQEMKLHLERWDATLQKLNALIWQRVPNLPEEMHSPTAAHANNYIYVADRLECNTHIYRLDLTLQEWTALPLPENMEIQGTCMIGVGDTLYLIGTPGSAAMGNEIWSFTVSDEWQQTLPPLPELRLCAVAVSFDGYIMVAGGGDDWLPHSTVEVINTRNPSLGWVEVTPLPVGISLAQGIVYDDQVLIGFGDGSNDTLYQAPIRAFKSLTDDPSKCDQPEYASLWTALPRAPVSLPGLSVVDQYLICVCGLRKPLTDQPQSSRSLYCFNPVCNQWVLVSHLNDARRSPAVLTLSTDRTRLVFALGGLAFNFDAAPCEFTVF